jgi:acetyltransferase-like isoleucine patch superfamily enzyme
MVHPSAVVEDGAAIGAGAKVGPHAHVERAAVVEPGAQLGANTVVRSGAHIGTAALLGPGVFVDRGCTIGADARIGPSAALLSSPTASGVRKSEPSSVADDVAIGANATVLAGVCVAAHAVVGPGAVVEHDVPPYAIAEGVPAHIVGYRSSAHHHAERRLRASELDDDLFPAKLGRATLRLHPRVDDLRGSLSFAEIGSGLPFEPKRYFTVFGVPSREVRGEHAHRELEEVLICVHGECTVMVNDGVERAEVVLDRPDVSLHLPSMVWTAQFAYSSDAVLLALCFDVYDAGDYIRSYDEFEGLVRGG